MINVAIVDDEECILNQISDFIKRANAEYKTETVNAVKYMDGLSFLEDYKFQYDIVFLDIEMPFKDGMKIAEQLRERDESVTIIFVTNMANLAVKGYSVQAYDFVVKPLDYFSFATLLNRTIKNVIKNKKNEAIDVTTSYNVRKLEIKDIYYISISGHKIEYHTTEGIIVSWGNLKSIEEKLEKFGFVRTIAYQLVNLKYVKAVKGYDLYIGDEVLAISRTRKKQFLEKLTAFLGR